MKTKRLILSVACVCLGYMSGFAQRKQNVEETSMEVRGVPFEGKMTYGYVTNEDGEHIRDGAFSLIINDNYSLKLSSYQQTNATCNYRLNANYQKGRLHGAMTLSANFKGHFINYEERGTENSTWSFRGNFVNGIPHGAFNIQHNINGNNLYLNATYNKGELVGNLKFRYSSLETPEGSFSLNDKGVLHGWAHTIFPLRGGEEKMEFVNGVLVNRIKKGTSIPEDLVSLARKYANKMITEEELLKRGITVEEDSIKLKPLATQVIFDEIIDFDKHIETYDFSTRNVKYYKYLKKDAKLSDKGFELFCKAFSNQSKGHHYWGFYSIVQDTTKNQYYIMGAFSRIPAQESNNDSGDPAVEFRKYITPKHEVPDKVSITETQYKKLKQIYHESMKDYAKDFMDIVEILEKNNNVFQSSVYINEREPSFIKSFILLLNNDDTQDKSNKNTYSSYSDEAYSPHSINSIYKIRDEMNKYTKQFSQKHPIEPTIDPNLIFLPYDNEQERLDNHMRLNQTKWLKDNGFVYTPINKLGRYINRESYEEFMETAMLVTGQYQELIKDADSQHKEAIDAKMKKIKDLMLPTETCIKALDALQGVPAKNLFTLKNSSNVPFNLKYAYNQRNMYDNDLNVLKNCLDDLPSEEELKKFGKIVSYQITESPIDELDLIYIRLVNKKGQTIDLKWSALAEKKNPSTHRRYY